MCQKKDGRGGSRAHKGVDVLEKGIKYDSEIREMRKVVYVAHPFSGKKENIDKVEKLIIEMVRQYPDFAFYSPLHAMGFYYFEKPYEEGMKDCLEILSRCDELWLCKGWENSRGCNMEKDFAEAHGIPIRYWGE